MIKTEILEQSLDSNKNLSNELKGNIVFLISQLNKKLPNIDLNGLSEKLKDVRLIKGSKFITDEISQYNPMEHAIIINEDLLEDEEFDSRYSMMKSLIQMTTAKNGSFGFGDKKSLEALNVGVLEIISNYIIGNEGKSIHYDEQVLVNSLADSIGADNFITAFFNNDGDTLIRNLCSRCSDVSLVNRLLDQINYNMKTRKQMGTSSLYSIQKQVMEIYGNGYSHIFRPVSLENNELKYNGYDQINEHLNNLSAVKTRG